MPKRSSSSLSARVRRARLDTLASCEAVGASSTLTCGWVGTNAGVGAAERERWLALRLPHTGRVAPWLLRRDIDAEGARATPLWPSGAVSESTEPTDERRRRVGLGWEEGSAVDERAVADTDGARCWPLALAAAPSALSPSGGAVQSRERSRRASYSLGFTCANLVALVDAVGSTG